MSNTSSQHNTTSSQQNKTKQQKNNQKGTNIANEVIKSSQDKNISPSEQEVENHVTGLTSYLLCLQEALQIVQKSNASTLEGLQQEIHTNKKVSDVVKSTLQSIIKEQIKHPSIEHNIDSPMKILQRNLQEGVKDITNLRDEIKPNYIGSQDQGTSNDFGQHSTKGILKNMMTGSQNLFAFNSDDTSDTPLADLRNMAAAMNEWQRGENLLSPNKKNGINLAKSTEVNDQQKKEDTANIITQDNTHIAYAQIMEDGKEVGLGEHEVKVVQGENSEGPETEQNQVDAELERNKRDSIRNLNVSYDEYKDAQVERVEKQTGEMLSFASGEQVSLELEHGISEQDLLAVGEGLVENTDKISEQKSIDGIEPPSAAVDDSVVNAIGNNKGYSR